MDHTVGDSMQDWGSLREQVELTFATRGMPAPSEQGTRGAPKGPLCLPMGPDTPYRHGGPGVEPAPGSTKSRVGLVGGEPQAWA